jgi:peptidoglycan hydrolase-like protein with peptidoglycan-binding domain
MRVQVAQPGSKETVARAQVQPQPAVQKPQPHGMVVELLNLQRTHGNRFVQQMLNGGMIQRKCACGGGCPRCQKVSLLQTKLKIGEPGDIYEQEADYIADQVMRMPETSIQRQIEPEEGMVRRKAITNQVALLAPTQASSEVPSIVHEVLRSPGQPLDPVTLAFMEPRFGKDFSQIRVHTGSVAGEAARSVNSLAYTMGSDVVFGDGQYRPGMEGGRKLLAHELAHTIQQSEAGAPGIRRKVDDGHDLKAPRFSRTPNIELEAAFDGELLISAESHSRGIHVRLIQESLLAQGYTLPEFRADGIFGSETKAAVTRFQTDAHAVTKDGIVGPETMRLLDEHDPSLSTGVGPVAITGPVPGPLPAPAPGCDQPYTNVKFALANQAGKGASPAAAIRILPYTKDRYYLYMQGAGSVWYRPEVTITAPDDPTAKQFRVGLIQNLLRVWRKAYYDDGSVVDVVVPTLPIKDGNPLSSGNYDPVFISSKADDVEDFIDKEDIVDLRFTDNPRSTAYISLLDNPSCAGRRLPGSLVRMEMYDEFRTWVAVQHQPTGCVRTLHHIDWNLVWEAKVTMLGNFPVLNITSNVSNVTVANGDGRPRFIQGGPVAKEITQETCL